MLNRIFNRPVAAAAIDSFDYVIVGSGIVGLAIAKRLSEQFGSVDALFLDIYPLLRLSPVALPFVPNFHVLFQFASR